MATSFFRQGGAVVALLGAALGLVAAGGLAADAVSTGGAAAMGVLALLLLGVGVNMRRRGRLL